MLRADERADRRGTSRRVLPSQPHDHLGVDTGCFSGPLWCPSGDVLREFVETEGVRVDPLSIDALLADDHVHHREHHRDVGTGSGLDELVGRVGGDRAKRIDHHHAGAAFTRRLDRRPEVPVGEPGIRAPQEDESGMLEVERIEAER
jgi:hypothetical protein